VRRKNKKFIDPRYFMEEKTEKAKTLTENERFTGGSIDIEPLSDEEQVGATDAYYELFDFLMNSDLPGNKPSEKLQYALRWIAKFEATQK
tara:strand:+ start:313 stop:582 length:270 start_codon:yes stop_codon:yes gene_type:complete